jgi:hypothetical protein
MIIQKWLNNCLPTKYHRSRRVNRTDLFQPIRLLGLQNRQHQSIRIKAQATHQQETKSIKFPGTRYNRLIDTNKLYERCICCVQGGSYN